MCLPHRMNLPCLDNAACRSSPSILNGWQYRALSTHSSPWDGVNQITLTKPQLPRRLPKRWSGSSWMCATTKQALLMHLYLGFDPFWIARHSCRTPLVLEVKELKRINNMSIPIPRNIFTDIGLQHLGTLILRLPLLWYAWHSKHDWFLFWQSGLRSLLIAFYRNMWAPKAAQFIQFAFTWEPSLVVQAI